MFGSFALCCTRQVIFNILLVMVYSPFFIKNLAKLCFDCLCSVNSLHCLTYLFFMHPLLWKNRWLSISEMDENVPQVSICIDSFKFLKLWLEHHRLSHQVSSKSSHFITHEIISSRALSKVSDFFPGLLLPWVFSC